MWILHTEMLGGQTWTEDNGYAIKGDQGTRMGRKHIF